MKILNAIFLYLICFQLMADPRSLETDLIKYKNQSSTPSNPPSGFSKVYTKSGDLKLLDSTGLEKSISAGNRSQELINGDFESGSNSWTVTNATTGTGSGLGAGSNSLSLSLTGALSLSQVSTQNAAQKNAVQMLASIWVKSTITDLQLCSMVNGAEDKCTAIGGYPGTNVWRNLKIAFLSGTTSNGLKLKSTTTSGTVLADDAFVGISDPLVDFNPDMVFSAKASSAGAISEPNIPGWISFSSLTDGSLFTYSLTGFTVAPTCTATIGIDPTGLVISAGIAVVSATANSLVIRTTASNTANSFIKNPYAHNIKCQKEGADYRSSKAYLSSNADQGWTAYTPSLVGFGTPTGIDFKYKLQGEDMLIQGYFVSGSSTPTQARIPLPGSYVVSSTIQSQPKTHWGTYIREISGGTTANGGALFPVSSQSYLTFGAATTFSGTSTTGSLTAQNGDTVAASGTIISLSVRVPIQGRSDSGVTVSTFQDVNYTPGTTTGRVESFMATFAANSSMNSNCATGACFVDQFGTSISGINVSGTTYTVSTTQTYLKLKCLIIGFNASASNGTASGWNQCSNCNSMGISTQTTGLTNSFGNIYCQGIR